jgi:two-component system chemotaxis response regulator CheB/chemosensory pili system protein ChpB (putative protein-glutamate methylesterase)
MSAPVVVVVSRPGAAADSLREALEQAGAKLAWIGEPEQLDPERPPGEVVVVNLDPAIEADLARLAPLWASERLRVVFNDAAVTEGLSGWDLTRWARHLVAKVFALGGHPELPERPPDAEPVPVAIGDEAGSGPQAFPPPPLRIPGHRYVEDEISEEMGAPPLPYDAAEQPSPSSDATPSPTEEPRAVTEPAWIAVAPPPAPVVASGAEATSEEGRATGEALGRAAPSSELPFTDDLDLIVGDGGGASEGLPPISIDPDAELEVPAAAEEDELEKLLRQAKAPSEPSEAPAPRATPGRAAAEKPLELKLAEAGEAPEAPSEGASGKAKGGVDWSRFRIDGLSLAPLDEERSEATSKAPDSPSAPMAAAPPPVPPLAKAAASSGADATVSRPAAEQLWILLGSFGAAEAIAQFLGQLRSPHRAALLIAVTGGDGPAALASTLAKRTGRSVQVLGLQPIALAAGDVWVVPEGLRLGSSTRGELRPERAASASAWLDGLLREAVGLFQSDCGAIVFSGASREGFDGTLAVAQRGGAVWVQDPGTAIAPDLPELVRSRGLAVFVGSPRALAEHFNQELG